MPINDAHCHLDQLKDQSEALDRAAAAGVTRILAVSEGRESGEKVLELKRAYPGVVLAGLGIHPMFSVSLTPQEAEHGLGFVRSRLHEADVLGEVGLDFKHASTDEQKAFQRELLSRMLDAARESGKPINLHSRWAQRQTLEVAIGFKRETGLHALMHWFTSSKKLIRICAEEGVFVSAGPAILFSEQACDVSCHIPEHLLLVETDSPVHFGGEPAEPAWAARVFAKLAEVRRKDPQVLEAVLNENFERYLGF